MPLLAFYPMFVLLFFTIGYLDNVGIVWHFFVNNYSNDDYDQGSDCSGYLWEEFIIRVNGWKLLPPNSNYKRQRMDQYSLYCAEFFLLRSKMFVFFLLLFVMNLYKILNKEYSFIYLFSYTKPGIMIEEALVSLVNLSVPLAHSWSIVTRTFKG